MIERTTCRICGGPLKPVFSLGELYVSNFLNPGEDDGIKTPLELVFCRQCCLVQLRHTVPPEALYKNYWYRSGTNLSMRNALADIAHKAEELMHFQAGDTVLDIGCNDGTLLASYETVGLYKIGFDPAENLASFSRQVADNVVTDFFGAEIFSQNPQLRARRPKLITSIAMFYDLEDPKKFVADVKEVLHPEGLWIIQMSYLPLMLKQNAFDNICHEHLEYYSLQSLEYLLKLYDLKVIAMELNDVNGGSFRVYIRHQAASDKSIGDATWRDLMTKELHRFREKEAAIALSSLATYKEFAFRVERLKNDIVGFIKEQIKLGKKIYVYGASTKGNTLLQYFGLDHDLITAAAERNPDKWGKITVGTHIPIVSEEEARAAKPEYLLVLPWHFIEEFQNREKDYLMSGGRFILPLPYFALI